MHSAEGEKSDGLEIISVGTLYNGSSWDKKYWSSSRGKDRYPYPIGYHAVRTHNGIRYKMEICEGVKGPSFVITAADGESCSGQTPDIAWKRFQKKDSPRVKLGQGKRFSCKIGGVELFGFRNPLVQRLLRELVADLNGRAERNLLSSSFCNESSRLKLEVHPSKLCAAPNLLTYLVKPHTKRKRSKNCNVGAANDVSSHEVKKLQKLAESDDVEVSFTTKDNQDDNNEEESLTSSSSDEDCLVANNPKVSSIALEKIIYTDRIQYPSSVKDRSAVESSSYIDSHMQADKLSVPGALLFTSTAIDSSKQETNFDRSIVADTEDDNREPLLLAESEMVKDLDLCAPDTMDFSQDNVSNPSPEFKKECPCNVQNSGPASDAVVSKDIVKDLHAEEESGTPEANGYSEKSCSDSPEDELTKSMMTVLLPQALPLLKKRSSRKRAAVHTHGISTTAVPYLNFASVNPFEVNDGIHYPSKILSPGKQEVGKPVNGYPEKNEGELCCVGSPSDLNILSSEDLKAVVPDSFEDYQCRSCFNQTCSNCAEVDEEVSGKQKKAPDDSGLKGCAIHIQPSSTSGKNERFNDEVPAVHIYNLEKDGVLRSDQNLGCMAANRDTVLEGHCKDVCGLPGWKALCLETCPGEDACMTKDQELILDTVKDISAPEPIFIKHNENEYSYVENKFHFVVPNASPSSKLPSTPTSLRSKRPMFDCGVVASSSEAASLQQVVPPTSIKKTQSLGREINNPKIIQYRRRHRSTYSKLKSSTIHLHPNQDICRKQDNIDPFPRDTKPQSSDMQVDQTNFNGCGNQDNIENHKFSPTRHVKDPDTTASTSSTQITEKEVNVIKTRAGVINTIPSFRLPNLPLSTKNSSGPLSESIVFMCATDGCISDNWATEPLIATVKGQVSVSGECLNREVSPKKEVELDGRQEGLIKDKGAPGSNVILSDLTSHVSWVQPVIGNAAKGRNTSSWIDLSIPKAESQQADASMYGDDSSLFQEKGKRFLDEKGGGVEKIPADLHTKSHAKSVIGSDYNSRYLLTDSELQECFLQSQFFSTDPLNKVPERIAEPLNKVSEGISELVGRYIFPVPVLSVVLTTQENDIHISCLCGLLEERHRTIFMYKMPNNEPRGHSPSFIGYTSIMLPVPDGAFCRKNSFERSGLQFTPDAQYLVLPNNIKAPFCRECNTHCLCALCASDCLEEKGLKVLQIRLGYVSLVAKLKTVESMCCILVCEPNHIVAVDESGKVHVWIMNIKWSAPLEEYTVPGSDYMYPCMVELQRIPKYTSVVIGHNGVGDFTLLDISKRTILSQFSAPGNSVFTILPIGLFVWEGNGPVAISCNKEEQIKGIMAASERWFSESSVDIALSSSDQEDVAIWLLVSAACDSEAQYNHQANGIDTSADGYWRLALLVKNMVIFGSPLDSRASSAGASEGLGIVGTHDGQVYVWELSTGIKVADLHDFKGGRVSCISADPKSGMVAMADDNSQLLVYCIQRLSQNLSK